MRLQRILFAATMIVGAAVPGFAQTRTQFVEYSAKFLCGTIGEKGGPLGLGMYETSINIHNPELPVPFPSMTFVKKVVLAIPEPEKPGENLPRPSGFRVDVLRADFAEHVNCKIIRTMLRQAGNAPFIEGFVVLITIPQRTIPAELDVTGVYTVNALQGQSVSLELVPISSRTITIVGAAGAKMRDELMAAPKNE
jgi:hypothetical protein